MKFSVARESSPLVILKFLAPTFSISLLYKSPFFSLFPAIKVSNTVNLSIFWTYFWSGYRSFDYWYHLINHRWLTNTLYLGSFIYSPACSNFRKKLSLNEEEKGIFVIKSYLTCHALLTWQAPSNILTFC